MITIEEAFAKFKSRLELTGSEQLDASNRHNEIRSIIREKVNLETDFLTGSYKRHTKTKPLKDVDIFCVLDSNKEGHFLKQDPNELLNHFKKILEPKYGYSNVSLGRRSVRVKFSNGNYTDDKVMSFDVVPAFAENGHYIIPDPYTSDKWTKTNPEIHTEKATAANKALSNEWKPMVKMLKKWNDEQGKAIKPSFLIEVMALEIFHGPFTGGYLYELKSFFATAKLRLRDTWNDPAGLGPAVSDEMTYQYNTAEQKLTEVGKHLDRVIFLKNNGSIGEALKILRDKIFGDMFPLS
ncbi:MAG TPA: CBASS oligonucleotide cyclase [Ignavibacteria bacterium]|jgi:hypothetical protein